MDSLGFLAQQEYVDFGTASKFNSLDTGTYMLDFKPNDITAANARALRKASVTTGCEIFVGDTFGNDGSLYYYRSRATTATDVRTSTVMSNGIWYFVAITDSDGTAPNIYLGTATTDAVEQSYASRTTGSGTADSDAAYNLLLGSRDANNTFCDGYIGRFIVYNRRLTLSEIIAHQWDPAVCNSGCVLKVHMGETGDTAAQLDFSPSPVTGTINNTPVLAAGPPLYGAHWHDDTQLYIPPPSTGPSAGLRTLALTGVGI